MSLIGHCDPQELWGKATNAAAASPLWREAAADAASNSLARLQSCFGHQPNPQRLRYYTKRYDNTKSISWKSYLSVDHKYVKCVLMLNSDNEVVDVSQVPQSYPERHGDLVTIVVIHTDRRRVRNSRILRSLPQPVQDIITSGGWDHTPATEAIDCPIGTFAPINVEFQADRGGKPPTIELLSVVNKNLIRDDNVSTHSILLYLPSAVSVPPGTQMLVDTHIRLRFPDRKSVV